MSKLTWIVLGGIALFVVMGHKSTTPAVTQPTGYNPNYAPPSAAPNTAAQIAAAAAQLGGTVANMFGSGNTGSADDYGGSTDESE